MPQIPSRLDDIPHPPLQLLGLGEPAVGLAVPEPHRFLAAGPFLRCCSHCCCFIGLVVVVGACYGDALVVGGGNVNDENAACGGLEGDLA
jgi:hypothetical protein